MGSFKRALFGYRRTEVEAAISARDARILGLELKTDARSARRSPSWRARRTTLSGHGDRARARDPRPRPSACARRTSATTAASPRSTRSPPGSRRCEAQARGQATRIRMKALREAVEVSRRVQALTDAEAGARAMPTAAPNGSRSRRPPTSGLFEGRVKLEIGPLGDFSQLVGFEDAVGQLGASEISVERFSEGRATLSMQPRPAGRAAARARGALRPRLQGPPHRPGQPDPRRRRGPGPRAARRLASPLAINSPADTGAVAQLEERRRWQREGQGFEPPQLHFDFGPPSSSGAGFSRSPSRLRTYRKAHIGGSSAAG